MSASEPTLRPPHFPLPVRAEGPEAPSEALTAGLSRTVPATAPESIGALVMRGADCLAAALSDCTADAGLNEARFRVLLALDRQTHGTCSQAELAQALLQSESNLSTLLERMSGDGLISRKRSQTDRRRSLIGITSAGREALSSAVRVRSATVMRLMRHFSTQDAAQLLAGLTRLVGGFEQALDVQTRRATGSDPAFGTNSASRPAGSVRNALT
jgi:DNA-binding MarR family transcriptional regulator